MTLRYAAVFLANILQLTRPLIRPRPSATFSPREKEEDSLPSPAVRGCPDASGRVRGHFTDFGCGSAALCYPALTEQVVENRQGQD